jgi:hypothetical protein
MLLIVAVRIPERRELAATIGKQANNRRGVGK